MAQPQRKTGMTLEQARSSLVEVEAGLAKLAADREGALMAGANHETIAKIDERIEAQQRVRRTTADRVRLMEAEAARQAAEKIARERAELIERVEKKLDERNRAVAKLADLVAAADGALLEIFAVNRAILAAWPWGNNLGAVLLGDGATVNALRNELFRVAGRPAATGGMPGDARGPSWPGGVPERLEWVAMPAKSSEPMVAKFEAASRAAIAIMRTGHNAPAPVMNGAVHPAMNGSSPNEQLAPSSPNPPQVAAKSSPELLRLLSRQNELVGAPMDDAADREYELNSARIRELAELGEGASQ